MVLSEIKTKCGRLSYVKKIVYLLGCGYVHLGDEHYAMFIELVAGKYSHDVLYFSIVPNRRNYGTYETQAHLSDGSISVFSWNKCALGRVDTEDKKLKDIMRSAIVPDILKFKSDAICCVLCGCVNNLQADHINPFRDLVAEYINLHGGVSDSSWINGWIIYHKMNAHLQILCAGCNYKKH